VHVQVERFQFRQKCIYIGIMLKRVINALHDASHFDDKDYYGALFTVVCDFA
jgi:DNA-directed RNA polymerase III subunit RPC2